jgi:molybdenum cofactor cytidylyltransferase
MTDTDLPSYSPPFETDAGGADAPTKPSARVAGVLLAAGTSTRFGDDNKLLATVDGDPLVRHGAQTLLGASVAPVIVVVGHEADRVSDALDGLDVEFVRNDGYAAGQSTSVRAGIGAVADRDVDAAVVALGDMPFVDPDTVRTLVSAYEAGVGDALAAAHDGRRGNPVLFDRRFFDALTRVDGDIGGREILLESDRSACVAVPDSGVRRDVDTPSEL